MCARDVTRAGTPRSGVSIDRGQRGMTLIELMVGIAVALLVALAAIGSAQFFMGRQRAALDVGSAAGNETNGLAALKYEVAHAGLGFFADGHALCRTLNLSRGPTAISAGTAVSPLAVTLAPGGTTIDVIYGSALEAVSPALLSAPMTSADSSLAVATFLPVAAGQSIMLVPADPIATPCTVRTATAVVTAPDPATLKVGIDATGSANQATVPPIAPVAYGIADAVVQLGELQWSRFRLVGGNLVMERPIAGTSAVMMRNVVAFVAEYGVADAGGSSVGSWHAATGDYAAIDAPHLATVRALRIGLVVRSTQPEKGACTTSAAAPILLFGVGVDLSAIPDAACYRYRVGTSVVPLRNVVFGTGA